MHFYLHVTSTIIELWWFCRMWSKQGLPAHRYAPRNSLVSLMMQVKILFCALAQLCPCRSLCLTVKYQRLHWKWKTSLLVLVSCLSRNWYGEVLHIFMFYYHFTCCEEEEKSWPNWSNLQVKSWVADKDAEALRCHKLLMEEEEAAQRR